LYQIYSSLDDENGYAELDDDADGDDFDDDDDDDEEDDNDQSNGYDYLDDSSSLGASHDAKRSTKKVSTCCFVPFAAPEVLRGARCERKHTHIHTHAILLSSHTHRHTDNVAAEMYSYGIVLWCLGVQREPFQGMVRLFISRIA